MELEKYLDLLGASEIVRIKIGEYLKLIGMIIPNNDPIQDVFITNSISEDTITFENLWFFTDNFILESKNFLSNTTNIDITSHNNFISRYEISFRNFDFVNNSTSKDSWLHIDGGIDNTIFEMDSMGVNCQYLPNIILKYFVPNIFFEVDVEPHDT